MFVSTDSNCQQKVRFASILAVLSSSGMMSSSDLPITALTIRLQGSVQGVGMRPAICRLARQLGLSGQVWNDAAGVTIQAWGIAPALAEFIRQIPLQAPPLAQISRLDSNELDAPVSSREFDIVTSQAGAVQTSVAADAALCPACLAEINDPANRRYRYPFTHCTDCGPRLSIVTALPYDRHHTRMAAFKPCPACQAEYENPADRRFHAQANACPVCGPRLELVDQQGKALIDLDADVLTATAALIRGGHIIAIKGVGGFHLACDAGNETAVNRLRQRKQRYAKPFAIMARDLVMLAEYVAISALEQQLLQSSAAPIVLLPQQGKALAGAVAPADDKLGCMLPYTPAQHILLQDLSEPIVLTSANVHEAPPCITNQVALEQLQGIADYYLWHDRDISRRLDDSVLRVMAGQPRLLRRARGYVPQTLPLPAGFAAAPPVLALGGQLKNTFCLLQRGQAIMSAHIGDLENAAVFTDYRQQLDNYQRLFGFQPGLLAVDQHEAYLSTQLGRQMQLDLALPLLSVQHHHAHIAACLAEQGFDLGAAPVLAVVLDGLGQGATGELWGGEFMLADYFGYQRLAAFQAIAMPGGAQAMRQPWRNTYAYLQNYFDWRQLQRDYAQLEIMTFLNQQNLAVLDTMLAQQLNAPLSSSCGRWFDALAAALGICPAAVSYEGQAAVGLEILATPVFGAQRGQGYPYQRIDTADKLVLSWRPFWLAVLNDLNLGVAKPVIAARIHHGLAVAIAETVISLGNIGADTVVLSGGVFQNRLLLEELSGLLRSAGKQVLSPSLLPANDGGLALGQAAVAAAQYLAGA